MKIKSNNKIKFETRHSWSNYIGLYLFVWIIYPLFTIIKDELSINTLTILIYASLGLYIIQQFILKKFILDDQILIISYPISFMKGNYKVYLKSVQNMKFLSNNSAVDPNRIIINFNEGGRKIFYFVGNKEYQILIDELRGLGIEVQVKSHLWK